MISSGEFRDRRTAYQYALAETMIKFWGRPTNQCAPLYRLTIELPLEKFRSIIRHFIIDQFIHYPMYYISAIVGYWTDQLCTCATTRLQSRAG